jgi:hypothetical protein
VPYRYTYTDAFELFADTLPDRSVLLYVLLAPKMKSGYDNLQPGIVGISSLPPGSRDEKDRTNDKPQPLRFLPAGGYCARFGIRMNRRYRLVFWRNLRDPKVEDPKAKGIVLYQEARLDSIPRPTAAIEQRLGTQCRETLGL